MTEPGTGSRPVTEPGTGPGTSDTAWCRISLVVPVLVLVFILVQNSVPVGSYFKPPTKPCGSKEKYDLHRPLYAISLLVNNNTMD